jgi:hypothetical protein
LMRYQIEYGAERFSLVLMNLTDQDQGIAHENTRQAEET